MSKIVRKAPHPERVPDVGGIIYGDGKQVRGTLINKHSAMVGMKRFP